MEKNSLQTFFEHLPSKIIGCFLSKNTISTLGFLKFIRSYLSKIVSWSQITAQDPTVTTKFSVLSLAKQFENLLSFPYPVSNQVKCVDCLSSSLKICFFIFLISSKSFAQVAPVDPPTGGFRIEGDVKANVPTVGQGDWVSGASGAGTYVIQFVSPNWVPVNLTTTKFIQDAYNNTSDLVFSGSAFSDNPNTLGKGVGWKWSTGKATNKCDINNAMYHVTTSSDSKWIILGGDRYTNDGTSYIDFEFLQNTLIRNDDNTFTSSSSNATGGRKEGDFVLSMEYSNGGTNATVHYYRWELSGTDYKYVEKTIPNDTNGNPFAFAMTNGADTDTPYGAFGSTSYKPYAFVEAAVNIDGILSANCESLSIKTIFVKTKASDSYNATLKDFVEPQQVNFQFGTGGFNYSGGPYCNEGTVSPATVTGTGTFSAAPAGLVFNNTTTGEINLATSTPGTYTITYTYQTGPGCTRPATQSITINPKPTAGISGTTAVCKNATAPNVTFTGSGGTTPYTFSYTINGVSQTAVSTTGTNNSVTVAAPTGTASTFTYALTGVQDAYCSNTATGSAAITVRPLPTALISGTTAVCQNTTAPNVTFTGSGGTTPYTFSYTINGVSPTTVSTTGTNNSVTVAAPTGTTGTFTYALTGVQDAYCSNTATGSAVITVRALPTAIINGAPAVCKNASSPNVTFTGSGGTTPYIFSYTVNGVSPTTVSTTGTNSSVTVAAPTGTASTFTYALTGVQDANCSNTASGSVVITINDQPAAPTFCVVLPSLCDITKKGSLTIVSPSGAVGVYEYSIDNGTNWQEGKDFNGLDPGAVTGVKVRNKSSLCESDPADCDESNICSPVNKMTETVAPKEKEVNNETQKAGFDAYPVPFKDQLTLKYNFDYISDVKIEVFDSQGISVLSKTDANSYLNKEVTLDLKLNRGRDQVYVVKVTTNRGSSIKKVISSR